VLLEQKLSTTSKAMKDVFGGMPRSRIALETFSDGQFHGSRRHRGHQLDH
jgi:hypothetical protein